MYNTAKEQMGIIRLKDLLLRTERIATFIKENDKMPSWDGELIVYKKKDHGERKDNIYSKISVQVKSKGVKQKDDLNKKQISFDVDVSDLKNYRNNGGVFFFEILVYDYDDYSIYYNPLLPFDLVRIIKNKEKQKTIAVRLNKLEDSDDRPEILFRIIRHFCRESKKQYSNTNEELINNTNLSDRLLGARNLTFSVDLYNDKEMFYTDTYLYECYKGAYIPLEKVRLEEVKVRNIGSKNNCILIDGEKINIPINIYKNKNENGIQLGECVRIVCINASEGKLKFIKKGNIDDVIEGLELMKKLSKANSLEIKDILISDGVKLKDDFNSINQEILFWKKAKKLFRKLDIRKKIDVRDFKYEDCKNI